VDLGVAPLLNGSALHLLVYHTTVSPILGATVGVRAQKVWDLIQSAYRNLKSPCRYSQLPAKMWTNEKSPHADYPDLTGKAAEQRHLVPAMRDVLKGLEGQGNAATQTIIGHLLLTYEHLDAMYQMLEVRDDNGRKPVFWSKDVQDGFDDAVKGMLIHYNFLTKEFAEREKLLFKQTLKFHHVDHLRSQCRLQNPVIVSCHANEDQQGSIRTMAHGAALMPVRGRIVRVLEKYAKGKRLLALSRAKKEEASSASGSRAVAARR